jgi:hypothetical protein
MVASPEHCKGCLVPGNNGKGECYADGHNENGDCPCTTCLVKTMCSGDCDLFGEFAERIKE